MNRLFKVWDQRILQQKYLDFYSNYLVKIKNDIFYLFHSALSLFVLLSLLRHSAVCIHHASMFTKFTISYF